MACPVCQHDAKLNEILLSDALKNEQKWIDIALAAAQLLEQAGLALPSGDLREKCLATYAEIRTTPLSNPKKRSSGRVGYADLKAGRAYLIDFN